MHSISTVLITQWQAMVIIILTVMIPMVFLEGFEFSIENIPRLIELHIDEVQLRNFNEIRRGIVHLRT